MVYWSIQTDSGLTGYQVMDDNRDNAQVVDDNGVPITGKFDYWVVDDSPPIPGWSNA